MSAAAGPVASSRPGAAAGALSWTVHPARQEPALKTAALCAGIATFSGLVTFSFGRLAYGIIYFLVLTASMARYFLPSRYAVDEEGVTWRLLVRRHRPWSAFRRVDERDEGLFLSPFNRPRRLDAFRGLYLPWGPDTDGAAVLALARSHVAP
ncbi:MAG: hypothetical protein ABIL09_15665 [Gemmatimonadota bacterium]